MQCEVHGCVADYVPGARKHQHQYRELGGFRIGDPVQTLDGRHVGRVSLLDRVNFGIDVHTQLPGQVVPARWRAEQLQHAQVPA